MNTKFFNINQKNRAGESGNVLFLILIAVILFAALSYAVTSSSRSGGSGDTASETNLVNSAAITQYPASVRTSMIRMLVNGRLIEDLIFDPPANFTTVETNNDEPDAVFHPDGGAATHTTAPANIMDDGANGDWVFSSEFQITSIGRTASGDNAANDIIAFLPGVTRAVCLSLNKELGIAVTVDADTDGIPDGPTTTPVNSQDTANPGLGAGAGANNTLAGDFVAQPFGCYDSVPGTALDDDQNIYYHVLIER